MALKGVIAPTSCLCARWLADPEVSAEVELLGSSSIKLNSAGNHCFNRESKSKSIIFLSYRRYILCNIPKIKFPDHQGCCFISSCHNLQTFKMIFLNVAFAIFCTIRGRRVSGFLCGPPDSEVDFSPSRPPSVSMITTNESPGRLAEHVSRCPCNPTPLSAH